MAYLPFSTGAKFPLYLKTTGTGAEDDPYVLDVSANLSTISASGSTILVTGLTDTELRASAVPVTAVLTTGAAAIGKLAAGTALIGKVSIDQVTANANEVVVKSGDITASGSVSILNMPAVVVSGSVVSTTYSPTIAFAYISGSATTAVKASAGHLHKIIVSSPTADAITVYNHASGSGPVIAVITPDSGLMPFYLDFGGVPFGTGLTIITAGNPKLTVVYD